MPEAIDAQVAAQGVNVHSQAVWQVMRYEGLMGNLQDAIDDKNTQEAQRLMQESCKAYKQLQEISGAEALLETGYYDTDARNHVHESYVSYFAYLDVMDTRISTGPDKLTLADPFYSAKYHFDHEAADREHNLSGTAPPDSQTRFAPYWRDQVNTSSKRTPLESLESFQNALDNTHIIRKKTTGGRNGDGQPLLLQSRTVLQLRGGGAENSGYGACGMKLCAGSSTPNQVELDEKEKDGEKVAIHQRVPHSYAAQVNYVLDMPAIALFLVLLDLVCNLVNMVVPWMWVMILGDIALNLVVLQVCLEIYLHSSLVKKEILEQDTVVATRAFFADNQHGHPVWIKEGWTGYVDMLNDAHWRQDSGAFITFEDDNGQKIPAFVPEDDCVHDLDITSGLYEYFSEPWNDFQVILLIFVVLFNYNVIPTDGAGIWLLLLRIIKPTARLLDRNDMVGEVGERHEQNFGEGEEEGGEGGKEGGDEGGDVSPRGEDGRKKWKGDCA